MPIIKLFIVILEFFGIIIGMMAIVFLPLWLRKKYEDKQKPYEGTWWF